MECTPQQPQPDEWKEQREQDGVVAFAEFARQDEQYRAGDAVPERGHSPHTEDGAPILAADDGLIGRCLRSPQCDDNEGDVASQANAAKDKHEDSKEYAAIPETASLGVSGLTEQGAGCLLSRCSARVS